MDPQVVNPELSAPSAGLRPTRRFVPDEADLMPRMVSDIATTKARLQELQEFIHEIMIEDSDYGKLPGMKQYTLYKPGAEKLLEAYGYATEIDILDRVERWDGKPFFNYTVRVTAISKRTGNQVGQGIGSCNSMEGKYRWRDAQRACPKCHAEALISGKPEYGRGPLRGQKHWVCFKRKGGCDEQFAYNATEIVDQKVGKVENDDVHTMVNTVLKMAKKRAYVDLALSVTRSSDLFVPEPDDDGDEKRADGGGNGNGTGGGSASREGRTKVNFRGEELWTKGITAGTLLRVYAQIEQIDKGSVEGAASGIVQKLFGTTDVCDLTDEQGKQLIAALESAIEDVKAKRPIRAAQAKATQDPLEG